MLVVYPPRYQTRLIQCRNYLPRGPWWGRQPSLATRRPIRPDNYLLAILPLDGNGLVADLETAFVHGKVAEHGLGLHLEQFFPNLVGIQTANSHHSVHEELAAGIGRRRQERGRVAEFFLISRNKLLISGVG